MVMRCAWLRRVFRRHTASWLATGLALLCAGLVSGCYIAQVPQSAATNEHVSVQLELTLDRGPQASYAVGDSATVCVDEQVYVPAKTRVFIVKPRVQLVLFAPDGQRQLLWDTLAPLRFVGPGGAEMASGAPACITYTVSGPTGRWTVTAQAIDERATPSASPATAATRPAGEPLSATVDFTVVDAAPAGEPGGAAGSATP